MSCRILHTQLGHVQLVDSFQIKTQFCKTGVKLELKNKIVLTYLTLQKRASFIDAYSQYVLSSSHFRILGLNSFSCTRFGYINKHTRTSTPVVLYFSVKKAILHPPFSTFVLHCLNFIHKLQIQFDKIFKYYIALNRILHVYLLIEDAKSLLTTLYSIFRRYRNRHRLSYWFYHIYL